MHEPFPPPPRYTRTLPELDSEVTGAILTAEKTGLRNDWLKVYELEKALAKVHRASTLEGQIARRGAVTAAISAKTFTLAEETFFNYLAEPNIPGSLIKELKALYKTFQNKL